MKHHIYTIGGATWDVLLTAPEAKIIKSRGSQYLAYRYGGKVDITKAVYGFGGGAANVSVSLAKLGFKVSAITRVGDDWRGQEVIKNLRANKVDTNLVQIDSKLVTPLSFIVTGGGAHEHVAFVDRGATVNLQLPESINPSATWFYLTSLVIPSWDKKLMRLFRQIKLTGKAIFWNPGKAQLQAPGRLKQLMPYVTIFDVNKEEAELLVNNKKSIINTVPALLRELKSLGPKAVLITDGARGAYYYDGEQILHQAALKIKPVNTTGAGDSFGSGFLAGLIYTGAAKKAMHWGMINSSSVITMPGAQKGLLGLPAITRGHL